MSSQAELTSSLRAYTEERFVKDEEELEDHKKDTDE